MDIRTKKWEILCDEEELAKISLRLGEQISKDYENKKLLVISILKGAMFFTSDLTKNIKIPTTIKKRMFYYLTLTPIKQIRNKQTSYRF